MSPSADNAKTKHASGRRKEELQLLTRISSSNSIIFSLVSQAPLNPGRAFQVGLILDSRFISTIRTNPTTGLVPPTRRTLRPLTTVTRAGPARCWLPETQHAAPDDRPAGRLQAQTMAAVGGSHALVEELEREKMSCTQAAACSPKLYRKETGSKSFSRARLIHPALAPAHFYAHSPPPRCQ